MSTVITVENLGKRYSLHHQQREQYTALRDVITNGVKNFGKKLFSPFTTHHSPFTDSEDFWALKDVFFEVKQGDRIGIIGRNGAGKSTLLKILSRITEPTTGSVRIKGRVASLLEVGTGFHPELTGRENIFLNGAILGMGRAEIKKKFDEIVDFAEIEKFLDTPVKRYSSGMYVRLAFAVAAHLEPEILIVDEVLAVGDAQFQKKCLGKMEDVSTKEGRTVLFVSHNLPTITQLCSECICLEAGRISSAGKPSDVIKAYLGARVEASAEYTSVEYNPATRVALQTVRTIDSRGVKSSHLDTALPWSIEINYLIREYLPEMRLVAKVTAMDGTVVFASADADQEEMNSCPRNPGRYVSICSIPPQFLNEGAYSVSVSADIPFIEVLFKFDDILRVSVQQATGRFRKYNEPWPGVTRPVLPWSMAQADRI